MADYHERRTVIETEPARRDGPVETEHEHISYERRGMSGAAVAAIVLSAVAAAVLLTLLFTNNQSDSRDAELARERAAEPVQTVPAQQPAPQQPVVITVPQPQTQTTPVPVPVPVPVPSAPASSSQSSSNQVVTNTSIEVDVISKLTSDPELRSHPINVKFDNGTVTLSGLVPREGLKARAELVAKSVKGVSRVVNDIAVQGQ
jgi:hypothetical protein